MPLRDGCDVWRGAIRRGLGRDLYAELRQRRRTDRARIDFKRKLARHGHGENRDGAEVGGVLRVAE